MLVILLSACNLATRERVEPTFFQVELGTTDLGTREDPLPFTSEPVSIGVTVTALDVDRNPYPFDGDLTVDVRPGKLDMDPKVRMEGGVWQGEARFHAAFGPTRLWFSDEGDQDIDSTRVPSFGAGVSDEIWYAFPTIAEMQATDDVETNQLDGEYAEMRVADRSVVVTAWDAAGFWCTDTADAPGTGNSLYVYTFSRPDDTMAVGKRVARLTGVNQEYLASTQLSYPNTASDGTDLAVPEAIELTGSTACDELAMERLEASRVQATDWQIPEGFGPGTDEYADFEEYGQWPLTLGGCTVYVESGSTAPDFYPPDYVGQTLPSVSGMVKEVFDKWVIVVVDADDLVAPSSSRAARRGPRIAPHLPRPPR